MSSGGGVALIVLGAVLYWGVDGRLGSVPTGTLGAVLMGVGLLVVVVSLAVELNRSPMGVGGGVGLLLAGAVCEWGLRVRPSFVDLDGLGWILMFCGAVAVAAVLVMEHQRSRTRRVVERRDSRPRTPTLRLPSRWS
jgi:hypothetical protein